MNLIGRGAVAGTVIGAVIGVVLHVLVWRPSSSVGGWTMYEPRRYVDYAGAGGIPGQTLTLHVHTSGGLHASWWPLLPITMIAGLVTGALLGGIVVAFRALSRRS